MTTENTSTTKILIIEDEIAIAEGLIDLCKLNGYNVKHCADGESGLAEALTKQYNLVLLDLMLPGMDGFTVCDKIREQDKSLPIIILSAKNADDDIINGLKYGADDYIPKPFSVPMLLARIDAVLRRSRQTMENEGKLVAGSLRVNFREYTLASAVPAHPRYRRTRLYPQGNRNSRIPVAQPRPRRTPFRTAPQGLGLRKRRLRGHPHRGYPHYQAPQENRRRSLASETLGDLPR